MTTITSKQPNELPDSYTLELQDTIDDSIAHIEDAYSEKLAGYMKQCLLITLLLAVVPLISLLAKASYTFTYITASLFVVWIVYLIWYTRDWNRKLRKLAIDENKNNPSYGLPCEANFSIDGIFVKSEYSEYKIGWSLIDRISQTDSHLFLYISTTAAITVPNRMFGSDVEFQQFANSVKQWHSDRTIIAANCPECNYSLEGGRAIGCPECGWNRPTAGP